MAPSASIDDTDELWIPDDTVARVLNKLKTKQAVQSISTRSGGGADKKTGGYADIFCAAKDNSKLRARSLSPAYRVHSNINAAPSKHSVLDAYNARSVPLQDSYLASTGVFMRGAGALSGSSSLQGEAETDLTTAQAFFQTGGRVSGGVQASGGSLQQLPTTPSPVQAAAAAAPGSHSLSAAALARRAANEAGFDDPDPSAATASQLVLEGRSSHHQPLPPPQQQQQQLVPARLQPPHPNGFATADGGAWRADAQHHRPEQHEQGGASVVSAPPAQHDSKSQQVAARRRDATADLIMLSDSEDGEAVMTRVVQQQPLASPKQPYQTQQSLPLEAPKQAQRPHQPSQLQPQHRERANLELLQSQLSAERARCAILTQQHAQLRAEHDATRAQLAASSGAALAELQHMQQVHATLIQQHKQAQAALREQAGKADKLQELAQLLADREAEVQALRARAAGHDQTWRQREAGLKLEWEHRFSAEVAHGAELSRELEAARRAHEELTVQFKKIKREHQRLLDRKVERDRQVALLQRRVAAQAKALSDAQQETVGAANSVGGLEARLATLRAKAAGLERALEAEQKLRAKAQEDVHMLEEECSLMIEIIQDRADLSALLATYTGGHEAEQPAAAAELRSQQHQQQQRTASRDEVSPITSYFSTDLHDATAGLEADMAEFEAPSRPRFQHQGQPAGAGDRQHNQQQRGATVVVTANAEKHRLRQRTTGRSAAAARTHGPALSASATPIPFEQNANADGSGQLATDAAEHLNADDEAFRGQLQKRVSFADFTGSATDTNYHEMSAADPAAATEAYSRRHDHDNELQPRAGELQSRGSLETDASGYLIPHPDISQPPAYYAAKDADAVNGPAATTITRHLRGAADDDNPEAAAAAAARQAALNRTPQRSTPQRMARLYQNLDDMQSTIQRLRVAAGPATPTSANGSPGPAIGECNAAAGSPKSPAARRRRAQVAASTEADGYSPSSRGAVAERTAKSRAAASSSPVSRQRRTAVSPAVGTGTPVAAAVASPTMGGAAATAAGVTSRQCISTAGRQLQARLVALVAKKQALLGSGNSSSNACGADTTGVQPPNEALGVRSGDAVQHGEVGHVGEAASPTAVAQESSWAYVAASGPQCSPRQPEPIEFSTPGAASAAAQSAGPAKPVSIPGEGQRSQHAAADGMVPPSASSSTAGDPPSSAALALAASTGGAFQDQFATAAPPAAASSPTLSATSSTRLIEPLRVSRVLQGLWG